MDNQEKDRLPMGVSNQVVARSKLEAFKRIKSDTLAKMMVDAKIQAEKGMAISSYGVKILPTKLFEEEERKLEGVDLGPETESIQSSKTTESVASIFQANAEYIQHLERSPPKPRGLYE